MAETKPIILLLSLELQPFFDEGYTRLIDVLSNKAAIQRVQKRASAINRITGNGEEAKPIAAILVTDAALVNNNANAPVWDAVLDYVRNGGIAIIMGHFASFARIDKLGSFFQKAGLPWDRGSYQRTDTVLNRSVVGDLAERLPQRYTQKALAVKNVAQQDIWYASAPEDGHEPDEAAVALAKVGEGRLAYVGDVNGEAGSDDVVLAMCGLL